MKLFKKDVTPEYAAGEAAVANVSMATMQVGASVLTGNLGFVGESLHNVGDGASFWAKRTAMNAEPRKSLRMRRIGASIFALGGVSGISAAAYEFTSRYEESTSTLAMGIAIACAGLNTYVAKRTHKAAKNEETGEVVHLCDHDHHHTHDHEEDVSSQKKAALFDTKLHAFNDAGTGWLYVAGLVLQKYGVHDAATWAVGLNGIAATSGAGFTLNRIRRDNKAQQE